MIPAAAISTTLVFISVGLIAFLIFKPSVTVDRGGKILAFVALFVLPLLTGFIGLTEHTERSKSTEFCLSCHVMNDHGKSLLVDDKEYIAAIHFQNNLVPRDKACYTCHTDYTMYGDLNAKLRGLNHLYAQYVGKTPDTLKLYSAYNNRECLQCHEGARSFEESAAHIQDASMFASMKSNDLSCMTSGCHDVVHDVNDLEDMDFWEGAMK